MCVRMRVCIHCHRRNVDANRLSHSHTRTHTRAEFAACHLDGTHNNVFFRQWTLIYDTCSVLRVGVATHTHTNEHMCISHPTKAIAPQCMFFCLRWSSLPPSHRHHHHRVTTLARLADSSTWWSIPLKSQSHTLAQTHRLSCVSSTQMKHPKESCYRSDRREKRTQKIIK